MILLKFNFTMGENMVLRKKTIVLRTKLYYCSKLLLTIVYYCIFVSVQQCNMWRDERLQFICGQSQVHILARLQPGFYGGYGL